MQPVLEYRKTGSGWLWSGELMKNPEAADALSEDIQKFWQRFSRTRPHLDPLAFRMIAPDELVIEISGLDEPGRVPAARKAGFRVTLVPPGWKPELSRKPVPPPGTGGAAAGYRPVISGRGWASPALEPAKLLHMALTRAIHSTVPPKSDANRAMRLANVSFEIDGKDLLLTGTDGHRLTLHRLVGFAEFVSRIPKAGAVVPVAELKARLPDLKNAVDVRLDFSGHEGQTHVYNYGFKGSYGPALVDAYNGSIAIDGRRFDIPVVEQEFIKWRSVFPRPEWEVALDARTLSSTMTGLLDKWAAAMSQRPKGRTRKEDPAGRLAFSGATLDIETNRPYPEAEAHAVRLATSGLNQKRPVRFYMNFRYLRDAARLIDGPVVISGENDGTKGADGETYLVKPVSILDPAGPTEILVMPMYPPR